MKKIEKLTPKQEAKLSVYRDLYISKFFDNKKEANFKEVDTYMKWLYKLCNLSEPVVVLCDNPKEIFVKIKEINNSDKIEWVEPSWHASAFNSWLSFYNYFNNEIFKLDKSDLLNKYSEILDLNIFWSICFDTHCFVSKNAIKFNRNNRGELHSTTEAAIQFRGGYSLYFVNGRAIEEDLFKKINNNNFSFTEFQKLNNEDQKAAIITIIKENRGNQGVLDFLDAEIISKETVKHTNTYSEDFILYKSKTSFNWANDSKGNQNVKLAWLSMICPSTGQNYLIEVCPTFNKAINAAKWIRPKQVPIDLPYIWQSAN